MTAEGVVENATVFTGTVRTRAIRITLLNFDDEPIPNTKCKVTFQDGQTMLVESDNEGVIKFLRKAQGKFEIEMLEEEAGEETGQGEA